MKSLHDGRKRSGGFALVVTLMLLILLTVIAVGLLGLATVSLRSTGQGDAAERAKANARLALMMALGDLQAAAGPDTRITATASILEGSDAAKQHLVGVWESRKFDASDLPSQSGYSQSGKSDKFKKWLVSDADSQSTLDQDFAESGLPPADQRVALVPELKTAGGTIAPVWGGLVPVKGKQPGSYAYTVLDEGVKARVDTGFRPPVGDKVGDLAASLGAGTRADIARIPGLGKIDWKAADLSLGDNLLHKVGSFATGGLLLESLGGSMEDYSALYHDTTASSLGLFTDVANGGLKQDLNSILNGDSLPSAYTGQNSRMYSVHLGYPVTSNGTAGQSEPSWAQVFNFASVHKNLTNKGGGPTLAMKVPPSWFTQLAPPPNFQQSSPMMPSVLKVQIYYSLIAVPLARDGNVLTKPASASQWTDSEAGLVAWASTAWDRGARYFMMICMAPVVTLHNPYNVNLEVNSL
jgi:hypothetical protein